MTHQENAATLEERFAALKATAKEAGCEIDIALTIGGVDKKIATKGEIVRVRDEILTKTFGVPIAELGELPSSIS